VNISRRKFLAATGAGAAITPGLAGLTAPSGVESDVPRDTSLWVSEIPKQPSFPQLQGDGKADLAIVGGGYTGLACAYYAKTMRPDWRVIVIDSHTIGSGASSRNTGAVYAKHVGISDPNMPQRGLERLFKFIEDEEIECDLAPAPTLMMCSSKREAQSAQSNLGQGETWIDRDKLTQSINSRYYSGAVEAPGFYRVQPAKLVNGHARAALKLGVELFENSPVLAINDGTPATLVTERASISAKHVFVATNAYTPRMGMYRYSMFPVHQYTLATRKLNKDEIQHFGLDRWSMRFENNILPVTYNLTPSGHFFVRLVLGYERFDSSDWKDKRGARALALKLFQQRYPDITDFELNTGWHGVTGHTARMSTITETLGNGNIHVNVAYNGLGIMPGHNSGYLNACRITGNEDPDIKFLESQSQHVPVPTNYYRNMLLKPSMSLLAPV